MIFLQLFGDDFCDTFTFFFFYLSKTIIESEKGKERAKT